MSSQSAPPREGIRHAPPLPPGLRCWAHGFGTLFAAVTFISMAAAADWKLWQLLIDPLAWMMLILAAATGITAGYALGCRLRRGTRA